jgi:aryl-alcohol dehydrogenase-like predicted oxidoreductase
MTAKLALGCMNFGKRTSEAESLAILERAVSAGIDVLDTANVYNDGASETIVGRFLRERGGAARVAAGTLKVATKCGMARVDGKPEGLSPAAIARACDGSLARLGVETIDIYYLHAPDAKVPIEDSLGALATLRRAGKIRDFGVSNYASWQILEMFPLCERLGLPRPVISQLLYNLLVRQVEIEYVRFALRYQLATTFYNPLAGGLLARPPVASGAGAPVPKGSRFDSNKQYQRRYWTERMFDATALLAEAAAAHDRTLLELAYAWLAARPGVSSILVGPGSVAHLDAAIAAVARPAPPELLARADEIHAQLTGTDATYAR